MEKIIKKFLENEIIKKGSSAFILKIIGSLLGYIFLLLVTRKTGAEAWGIFALCLAVLNIVTILSRMGIDIAILKYISSFGQDISKARAIYLKGLKIVFPLSLFVMVFLFFFSEQISIIIFKKIHLTPFIRLISLAILPFTIIFLNAQSFRGLRKISHFVFFQHVSKYFFAIIFLFVINYFTNFDVYYNALYAFISSLFLVMIISTVLLKKEFTVSVNLSPISTKELLRTSFPMMLSSSVLLMMSWVDSIIIGIFKPDADIGIYNVAIRLAMISSIILGSVNSIVAPKLSFAYNNNIKKAFAEIVKESTRLIFFSTLPILLLLVLFPTLLLSIFGEEFINGRNTLLILLIGQAVNAMSGSVGVIMQMTGKEKQFQNILFFALLINISLNLFLIPVHGILGAAIASTISIIFWNITSVLYIYRKLHVLTFINFIKKP